jgi:hypothetical protein
MIETTFFYKSDKYFDKPYEVSFRYTFTDRIYNPITIDCMFIKYDNSVAIIPKEFIYLFNEVEHIEIYKQKLLNHYLHLSK